MVRFSRRSVGRYHRIKYGGSNPAPPSYYTTSPKPSQTARNSHRAEKEAQTMKRKYFIAIYEGGAVYEPAEGGYYVPVYGDR